MRWFRFYSEALNDPKVQTLPPELFKHWVNILCIASNGDGLLPETLHETAYALRVTESECKEILSGLEKRRLLCLIGNTFSPWGWQQRQYKSDTSTDRVKRFRERNSNVSATPPDTETDTDINYKKTIVKKVTKAKRNAKSQTTVLERFGENPICPAELANDASSKLGFSQERIDETFAAFYDHHLSKGSRFTDHAAAFRTWCRNEVKFASRGSGKAGGGVRDNAASAISAVVSRRYGGTSPGGSVGGGNASQTTGHDTGGDDFGF